MRGCGRYWVIHPLRGSDRRESSRMVGPLLLASVCSDFWTPLQRCRLVHPREMKSWPRSFWHCRHHTGIHDPDGNVPILTEHFPGLLARCQNARLGRFENFWSARTWVPQVRPASASRWADESNRLTPVPPVGAEVLPIDG